MVDKIATSHGGTVNELHAETLQAQQIGRIAKEAEADKANASLIPLFGDHADISNEALSKLTQERAAFPFVRLAVQQDEPFDAEKVNRFKAMLDNGRINDYLRDLGNDALADSLLDSPMAPFLKG